MAVDYSRNYFFNPDIEANKPPDKPASGQLNEITNYDDVGFYYRDEKGIDSTVLNYFCPTSSDKPVVINPREKNQFLFIITNLESELNKKQMKKVQREWSEWIQQKFNDILHNISEVKTEINVLINPKKIDITMSLHPTTRGIFVFDHFNANNAGLDYYDELKLADSLKLKELIEELKKMECKSIVLGIFSQQIQNSLNDVYAIDQLNKLVTSDSEEIGLLLLPLASKPIEHKMNFEIIACIEFIANLLTDDHGSNQNLISAQEIIASRMRDYKPGMEAVITQACAIFLGYQQSKIGGASNIIKDLADARPFGKTGLESLDDLIEKGGGNGQFGHAECSAIVEALYDYISKAKQICNFIVRSNPEYRELFFSLVLSMKPESYTNGKVGGEKLNKEWLLKLWNSYKVTKQPDILGYETLRYRGGRASAESNIVMGFAASLNDLNKGSKCKGSQLILELISDDFDGSKKKYSEFVKQLKNGNMFAENKSPEETILSLLLLDEMIAKKIHALLQQLHDVLHGPRAASPASSFASTHLELYVEPEHKRKLNLPRLRATLNNLSDLIGAGMGGKVYRGILVSPQAERIPLDWWVE
tara:strand:+ start:54 stop:1823 length:1770 start_codon:yes stop_codon:yes gene_type:complete